jgi:pantothenate kinase
VKTFAEVEQLCNAGNNANIDLLVSDIYGTGAGYESLGLRVKQEQNELVFFDVLFFI